MATQRKVIITCAVTGSIHTPSMSPYLPITAAQIADAAIGAIEAGAAIVHLQTRYGMDPGPWRGPTRIRSSGCVELEALGLDIASPDDARHLLGLKGATNVGF